MNIKEALKNYTKDRIVLDSRKDELKQMPRYTTTSDKIATSMNEYPYLYKTSKTYGQVERHQWRMLNEQITVEEKRLKEIEDFVDRIGDATVQKAVKLFYLAKTKEDKKWDKVAKAFNYRMTAEAIRNDVKRYLRNF